MAEEFEKDKAEASASLTPEDRQELLKSYIRRLGEGEDLESVRKDFVSVFQDVDAMEIMKAEQALMSAGVPLKKVQKLCDIHSALFHGKTREEQIANAEKAVAESMRKNAAPTGFVSPLKGRKANVPSSGEGGQSGSDPQMLHRMAAGEGKEGREKAKEMMVRARSQSGHPVQILVSENEKISEALQNAQEAVRAVPVSEMENDRAGAPASETENGKAGHSEETGKKAGGSGLLAQAVRSMEQVHALSSHYRKKGDLLYPLLKSKYAVTGPSQVMWNVDGEIRTELGAVCRKAAETEEWKQRAMEVLTRAQEMVFKENNILFPICLQCFSQDEWIQIRREFDAYEPCLIGSYPVWKEDSPEASGLETGGGTEETREGTAPGAEGNGSRTGVKLSGTGESAGAGFNEAAAISRIQLGSGHFTKEQLEALLNTLPVEITFVDENNINSYFNDGPENKLFQRPHMALGREVFDCHPPRVQALVRSIISDFREGKKDSVEIWHQIKGEPVLVRYMAVRDKNGTYLGTMELVQRMGFAEEHFRKS